ncbi:hypothetical protein LCGC14_0223170 [marine sediment metagenome]|uniref:Uncharacterized protein n=1 Tax=marine sediment metagenome TaxID=412755 RepID=A0A0F9UGC4_9ZZZZ|nr:hypothetical protein [bacterium]
MPNEFKIFIKCDVKPKYDRKHPTQLKRDKERLINVVENIKKKLKSDDEIIYTEGCAFDTSVLSLGSKEEGDYWRMGSRHRFILCDFDYLGLHEDVQKTAEVLHKDINDFVNSGKTVYEKCNIYWGWEDKDFDSETDKASRDLSSVSFKDVYCPACWIIMKHISGKYYRCPKCRKVIKS